MVWFRFVLQAGHHMWSAWPCNRNRSNVDVYTGHTLGMCFGGGMYFDEPLVPRGFVTSPRILVFGALSA